MAKKRLSRDQKRKAKLAQRARKDRAHESLAYTGNRYKGEDLVPLMHRTETAIYECFVLTGRALIDRRVYLPKSWTGDPQRCAAAGIPAEAQFATKPELALEMITGAVAAKLPAGASCPGC